MDVSYFTNLPTDDAPSESGFTDCEQHQPTMAKNFIYCDEISPGNQLKVHNRRKLQSVYFSVQEYGGFELTQEHAWSVLTCIRTDLVNKLQDGMSQFFRHCVKAFLKTSGNMSTGISVQVHGEDRIMCFVLSYILADEAALKQVVENKGASGKMLCLFCQTTVNARYALPIWANWCCILSLMHRSSVCIRTIQCGISLII